MKVLKDILNYKGHEIIIKKENMLPDGKYEAYSFKYGSTGYIFSSVQDAFSYMINKINKGGNDD